MNKIKTAEEILNDYLGTYVELTGMSKEARIVIIKMLEAYKDQSKEVDIQKWALELTEEADKNYHDQTMIEIKSSLAFVNGGNYILRKLESNHPTTKPDWSKLENAGLDNPLTKWDDNTTKPIVSDDFYKIEWAAMQKFRYNGKIYTVSSVDFEERLIAFDDSISDQLQWVRYENIELC